MVYGRFIKSILILSPLHSRTTAVSETQNRSNGIEQNLSRFESQPIYDRNHGAQYQLNF
jgi:hypothetical protein